MKNKLLAGVMIMGTTISMNASIFSSSELPPEPWHAVEVEEGHVIKACDKEFIFDKGPLPVNIKYKGKEMLAAVPVLELDGGKRKIEWGKSSISADEKQAVIRSKGYSEKLLWKADTTLAYDGLVWVTLNVRAARMYAGIDSLSFIIKIKNNSKFPRLYSHQLVSTKAVPVNWRGFFMKSPGKLWNAGLLPGKGWLGQFTPQIWSGNFENGMAVYAESPENWPVSNSDEIMSILPAENGDVIMKIDFVMEKFKPGSGWTFSFGFQPTPVRRKKEYNEYAERIQSSGGDSIDNQIAKFTPANMLESKLKEMAANGVKVVLLWNEWSNVWGFPEITDPKYKKYVHKVIDKAHSLGMKVIPYCGALLGMPNNHPDKDIIKRFILSNNEFRKNFIKGQGNYRAIFTPEFNDWYVENIKELFEEFNFDGIYLDSICKPDFPLEKDRVVYSMRNSRDFYKKIYELMHGGIRKNGIVFLHDSEPNIFMFSGFADARLSGEMQYYCAARRKLMRSRFPDLKDRMPLEMYYVWTSGMPTGSMPTYWCRKAETAANYSVGHGIIKEKTIVRDMLSDEEDFALAGLFNMHISAPPTFHRPLSPADTVGEIWKLEDRLDDECKRIPYWKSSDYLNTVPNENIKTALMLDDDGKLLIHAANISAKAQEAVIELKPETGLDKKDLKISGTVTGGGASAKIENGKIRVKLNGNSFARIMIEEKE